jgi:hypothetical protein
MRADVVAAMLSLVSFGFPALMECAGKLAGIDGTKVRLLAWIVQDVGVGNLGRSRATVVFCRAWGRIGPDGAWVRRNWHFG